MSALQRTMRDLRAASAGGLADLLTIWRARDVENGPAFPPFSRCWARRL